MNFWRAMSKEFTYFKKPKNKNPTPHLWVANGGIKCGYNTSQLNEIFSKAGKIERIVTDDNESHSFVSFENPQDAISAKSLLDNKFNIRYADYKPPVPKKNRNRDASNSLNSYNKVPGLLFFPEVITKEEEEQLINQIDSNSWLESIGRRVQHYGYEFNYKTKNIDLTKKLDQMPSFCNTIIEKMKGTELWPFDYEPDQVTVNEYLPGQGIAPHVDTHSAFEDGIASLSLGSSCVFTLQLHKLNEGETSTSLDTLVEEVNIVLPPRSLVVMTAESRYLWIHGIPYRTKDTINGQTVERVRRLSLTIRKVKGTPCECKFPMLCDSKKIVSERMKPTKIEKEHVHEFYESIAEDFSHTRHTPWPKVKEFLLAQPQPSLIADVGCGNGRHMNIGTPITIGCDRGIKLSQICQQKGLEVFVCDILTLPYRDNLFDATVCIAVLHHLSTEEHRLQAVKNLVRITKPGGEILISVWALEQDDSSKRQFEQQDVIVPWKSGSKENPTVFQRYCHVYKEGELSQLCLKVPNVEVLESFYDHSNWCVRIKKLK